MKFLLLVIVSLLFITPVFPAELNVLENPGFEEGDFPPAGWSDWSGSETDSYDDGVAGFPAPSEEARSGNKAVGKIFYGSKARWGGLSQTVSCSGGGLFSASGYVRNKQGDVALGGGGEVFLEVKFLDDAGEELKKVKSMPVTGPCSWKKLSVSGTAPHRARSAVFSFVMTGAAGAHGKVLFDDAFFSIQR